LEQETKIPRQLPKGVSEQNLQASGATANSAMNSILVL